MADSIAIKDSIDIQKESNIEVTTEIIGEELGDVPKDINNGQVQDEQAKDEIVDEENQSNKNSIQEDNKSRKSNDKLDVEEVQGEEIVGENVDNKEITEDEDTKQNKIDEEAVDEEQIVEEPPPDPAAPLNFSDSKEALKPPFELRQDQLAEVEILWELYQNYTPAYTDINGYITEKELIYLLKSILLMTYTEEQFYELISYCVRPSHPEGHINFEQFVKIVTLRQRDFIIEDELRSAFQVMDPGKTGQIEREYVKDVLKKYGNKMSEKQVDNLIKEIDMTNDGQIGIDDAVGTICIDLNKEDLLILMESLHQDPAEPANDDI